MSTDHNKAMTERFINEAFNHGELGSIDETHASDWVLHSPGAEIVGPKGIKELVMLYRNAFPDYNCTINDQIAEGDRVVTRWTMNGTHDGEMMGIAATGKKVTIQAWRLTASPTGSLPKLGWRLTRSASFSR